MSPEEEAGPDELLAGARDLIAAAAEAGVPMRLLGGLAVYALAPSVRSEPLARRYRDFDVAVPAKRGPAASRVLEVAGLVPDRHFNALHGARRMIFQAPRGFSIDVLIGAFQMCHTFEIEDGFDRHELTIAPSDLLLTKLQIVTIELKDMTDATALLLDAPLGSGPGTIELDRFAAPLAEDWGFYHTVELNLERIRLFAEATLDPERSTIVDDRVSTILHEIQEAPKSLRWRIRSRVGERVTWYETPEEVH